jgi:hypothetical protein
MWGVGDCMLLAVDREGDFSAGDGVDLRRLVAMMFEAAAGFEVGDAHREVGRGAQPTHGGRISAAAATGRSHAAIAR